MVVYMEYGIYELLLTEIQCLLRQQCYTVLCGRAFRIMKIICGILDDEWNNRLLKCSTYQSQWWRRGR